MANFVVLNDNTLRQRLRQFGFRPDGPITDTTRDVYVRKLQRLEGTRGAQSSMAQSNGLVLNAAPAQTFTRFRTALPAQGTIATPIFNTSSFSMFQQSNSHQSELIARSAPTRETSESSGIVHGSLGNRFLAHFNDRTHVTSDVCFISSQDGTLLFASRALLVTSCPGMTHLLYNTSESFPICLHTATGSMTIWCHLDDLVKSLKYKITLLKGIPVMNQSLFLDGQILPDELQASSLHSAVTLRATSINPSLSIVRFTPLASRSICHELPVTSQQVSIPYQVIQLVIVSDVPGTLLSDFIRYLYTGSIAVTVESAPTLCAFSEAFTIEDLQQLSLSVVDDNINNRNIRDLLHFSHHNQIRSLKRHCLQYIRRGQCNVDRLCQHFHNNPELVQDIINNNSAIS